MHGAYRAGRSDVHEEALQCKGRDETYSLSAERGEQGALFEAEVSNVA
jgi:hypothetical protein